MDCRCPACKTEIKVPANDFPIRCRACGARLAEERTAAGSGRFTATVAAISGWRTASRAVGRALTDAVRPATLNPIVALAGDGQRSVLHPDSRAAIARAQARQAAMQKALLRGRHQALGALSLVGLALVAMLAGAALLLGANGLWMH